MGVIFDFAGGGLCVWEHTSMSSSPKSANV